jgi:predicted HD phosphohydrolase
MTAVQAIGELFAGPGAGDYLGEPVTIGTHMLQAAALAEAAMTGAGEPAGHAAGLRALRPAASGAGQDLTGRACGTAR